MRELSIEVTSNNQQADLAMAQTEREMRKLGYEGELLAKILADVEQQMRNEAEAAGTLAKETAGVSKADATLSASQKGLSDDAKRSEAELKKLTDRLRGTGEEAKKATPEVDGLSRHIARLAGPAVLIAAFKQTVAWTDSIADMSKQTGISTTALQKWDFIAKSNSDTLAQMTTAAQRLGADLTQGDKSVVSGIEKMGLSVSELLAMNPEDRFREVAIAIAGIKDPAEQAARAEDVMKRAGTELIDTMKDLAAGAERDAPALEDAWVKAGAGVQDAIDGMIAKTKEWMAIAFLAPGVVAGKTQSWADAVHSWLYGDNAVPRVRDMFANPDPRSDAARNIQNEVSRTFNPGFDKFDPLGGNSMAFFEDELTDATKKLISARLKAAKATDYIQPAMLRLADENLWRIAARGIFQSPGFGGVSKFPGWFTDMTKAFDPSRPSAWLQTGPLDMGARPQGWSAADDGAFQKWYAGMAERFDLDRNPDAPEHAYNYRFAFRAGVSPDADAHWPSEFKAANHPNRFVNGVDTARFSQLHLSQPPPWMNGPGFEGNINWGNQMRMAPGGTPFDFSPLVAPPKASMWQRMQAFMGSGAGRLLNVGMGMLPGLLPGMSGTGGSIGGGIGGALGGMSGVMKSLGGFASFLGPIGGIVGGLLGKLFGPSQASQTRKARGSFIEDFGGMDKLKGAAADAGFNLDKLFATKKVKDFEAEVKKLSEALQLKDAKDNWIEAMGGLDSLKAKAKLAGISIEAALNAKNAKDFEDALKKINKAFEDQQKRIEGLNVAAGGLTKMLDGFALMLERGGMSAEDMRQRLDTMGQTAVSVFLGIIQETGSWSQALEAVGPSLDRLADHYATLGIEATGTLAKLLEFSRVSRANQDIALSVQGAAAAMDGMGRAGRLTQADLTRFATGAQKDFDTLINRGVAADQALMLMQPTLQKLWEAHNLLGLEIDSSTQNLIDLAQQQGLVGPGFVSTTDRMIQVMEKLADTIASLADYLGMAADAAGNLGDVVNDINIPEVPGGGGGEHPEYVSRGGVIRSRGNVLYMHRGGFVPRGTDTVPAMLTPGEMVVARDQVKRIAQGAQGATPDDARFRELPPPLVVVVNTEGEAVQIVKDHLGRWIGGNVGQLRTTLDNIYAKKQDVA